MYFRSNKKEVYQYNEIHEYPKQLLATNTQKVDEMSSSNSIVLRV